MLAVIKENIGKGYKIRDIKKPIPKSKEVLIKVKVVGICGTDIPIFDGFREVPIPLIPGHEFAGIVEDIGSNVTKFNIGDRVTAGLVINCGKCIYCKNGLESLCENILETGIHVNGAFAEYVTVPEKTLHKLSDNMTFEEGASIDPIASAYRIISKANISSKDTVAIFGPGPIGLYAVQCAKAEGAKKVINIGTKNDEKRLELSQQMGADYTINLGEKDLFESLNKITYGHLPDVVVEATGNSKVFEMCINSVKKHGRIAMGGIFHNNLNANIAKIVRNELQIKGSICYTWDDFKHCIDLVSTRKVKVNTIITHKFELKDIDKGLKAIKNREAVKVMLYP